MTNLTLNTITGSAFRNHTLKKWLIIGIILNIIASIFSIGFLHWDEYYQILEFLNFKLGGTPPEHLPYEYSIKMRSWFQPFIYYNFVRFYQLLSIDNPFIWTFSFRILSMLLGQACLIYGICVFAQELQNNKLKKLLAILFSTMWFFPFIHSRLSGECVGGSIFFIAWILLYFQISKTQKNPVKLKFLQASMSGLLMGFAFSIRFHIGFMILFFLLWAFIYKKLSINSIFYIIIGIIFSILLCLLIDIWGYGEWSLAPWNYFFENILNDRASYWGVAPFWDYFRLILKKGIYPVGILIILGGVTFWITNPKHPITWTTFPFFLIHCLVGHKELRFLFPLAHFLPFMLVMALLKIKNLKYNIFNKHIFKLLIKIILVIIVTSNSFALIISIFKPVHASIPFYMFTYNLREPLKKIYIIGDLNPYKLAALNVHFYNFHNPEIKIINKYDKNSVKKIINKEQHTWFFSSRGKIYYDFQNMKQCKTIYLGIPKWLLNIKISNWQKRSRIWALHQCSHKEYTNRESLEK